MSKDDKFVCSDFPQYEIKWGLLTQKSEEEIKEWIKDNVRILCASLMSGVLDIRKSPSFFLKVLQMKSLLISAE